MSAAPAPTWTWRLRTGSGPGRTRREVVPGPAGPVPRHSRALAPEPGGDPAQEDVQEYRGVRAEGSVADALRSPVAPADVAEVAPDVTAALHALRVDGPPAPAREPARDSTTSAAVRFLDRCAGPAAAVGRLRRHLVSAAADCPVPSPATVGLGRLVRARGVDGCDVLLPAARPGEHAETDAETDTARVVAELWTLATLFSAAGKPSAPQLQEVYRAVVDGLLAGPRPPAAQRIASLVPVMVVDHARRLAAAAPTPPAALTLELTLAVRWLDRPALPGGALP